MNNIFLRGTDKDTRTTTKNPVTKTYSLNSTNQKLYKNGEFKNIFADFFK